MPKTRVRPSHRLLAVWLPLAALTLVLATLPHASQLTPATPALSGQDSVGMSSMRAFIDPETGAISSLPAPALSGKALMPQLSRSSEGLTPVTLPDGTVMVNLQGRFQNASIARIDVKGVLHTICTEDFSDAQRFLSGAAAAVDSPAAPASTSRPMEVK